MFQFGHGAKDCTEKDIYPGKVQHADKRISKHKGCPQEEEQEEIMAGMFLSCEIYSSIQLNRNDENY